MALKLDGELLAVRTQRVPGGVSAKGKQYDAFERTTLTVFDAGRTYDVDVVREFPVAQLSELRRYVDEGVRPIVVLDVYASRYGLNAVGVLDAKVPSGAKA